MVQYFQQLRRNGVETKESNTSAIGLPKQKRQRTGGVPFFKKNFQARQRHVLAWFVEVQTIDNALTGTLIEQSDVEQILVNIPSTVLKPQLDLNLIKPLFTESAWMALEAVVKERKGLPWLCHKCESDIREKQSICCDSCMEQGWGQTTLYVCILLVVMYLYSLYP